MIERVDDDSGFRALRAEWTALLAESDAASVFLTWEWLYTWWRHLAPRKRPAILTVRSSGRLVALAPMIAHGWDLRRLRLFRSVGFLGAPLSSGNVGSDYLDVLVSREHPEARAELAEALRRTGRVLDLAQVSSGTATAETLVSTLRATDWRVYREDAGLCPIVELQERTWVSYLESRGREHRYSIQRKLRGLRKHFDVFFEQITTESDRPEALATLMRLHELRWQEKGESDAFHTAALRGFHEAFTRLALAEGWLRLYVLRLSGVVVSALYGLRYGDTFSFYQSGFDPAYARHGVGAATMALSIEAALSEGARCYDLLHGAEEYKFHWANATRPLVRYALFPPRPQGHAARALSALSALVRPMARRVLQSP